MTQLVPCDGCARHVRAEEGPCPFCGAAVRPAPRAIARHGATRAAIFYFGATLAACGGQSQPEPESTIVQPYGAPPDPDPPEPPPDPIEPESVAAPYGAPPNPPPPVVIEPDSLDQAPRGRRGPDIGSFGQPYGASPLPPPPPPPETDPLEPRAIVPPYGAPALPDSEEL